MKKFILVDGQGNTLDQEHIESGKFRNGGGETMDASVAAIMKSGTNSPILAVMNYPEPLCDGLKMFLLHVWNLENEGYSIVKEVPLPVITTEHKLNFAIKAVGAIYDFPDYKVWADNWLSGHDRSLDTLEKISNKVNEEIDELESMQNLAYSFGEAIDSELVGVKKALFERAKMVFHAAELLLNSKIDAIFDQELGHIFDGIEKFVNSEKLSNMSEEIINVA